MFLSRSWYSRTPHLLSVILLVFTLKLAAETPPPGKGAKEWPPFPTHSASPYDSLITRAVVKIIETQHYDRPKINDKISRMVFEEYFNRLDPNHYYFLQSDIDSFSGYREKLDDQLRQGDLRFADAVFDAFGRRVRNRLAFIKKELDTPFDFTSNEEMRIKRTKLPWAKTSAELDEIWRKRLKNQMLVECIAREVAAEEKKKEKEKAKNTNGEKTTANDEKPDDPPMKPAEKILKRYVNYYKYLCENDNADILENYLSAFTHVFDPHSAYMNWRTKEDFDIQMKLSLQGIGATLTTENGYTKVVSIVPGGPADRDGRLHAGDYILAVGQGDAEAVDVVDMPLTRVVRKIRGKKGTKVVLTTVRRIHGVPRLIDIIRDKVTLTEQEARSSIREVQLPDSPRKIKIGVIDLPSFYADFRAQRLGKKDARSTTTDVKKLIDTMIKTDQIQGLVIDLRGNPGGSLAEAIRLSGLFIPSGPMVQVQRRLPNMFGRSIEWRLDIKVENDHDKNFAYTLPMVVMVNRLSASAAEIFSGAIQDYGRGVIVGDKTTHGKGTVQTIQDLARRYPILKRVKPGALKYTMGKFYRITGASTQLRGVHPDIVFPDFLDYMELGEDKLDHAMPWDEIPAQKFTRSQPDVTKFLPQLRKKSRQRRAADPRFQTLIKDIQHFAERQKQKMVSLNKKKRMAQRREDDYWAERSRAVFGERKRDKDKKDKKKKAEFSDLYLNESLAILGDLIALENTKKN